MNILITGATGKLGQNIVERLYSKNKLFVLTRNTNNAKEVFKEYKNVKIFKCDLCDHNQIKKVSDEILERAEIDIIINNAALDIDQPMITTKKEDFEKIMSVNMFAPYYLCQYFIPDMMKRKFGKIINISSDLSMRTVKNATEYSMTKAGLDALTRSIAVEYGEYGITANTININGMKGFMIKVNEESKKMSKKDEDYDDWKQPKERIPLKRRGTFEEFVNVIEFLCSNKSNYINGVCIPVDGGIIAKL